MAKDMWEASREQISSSMSAELADLSELIKKQAQAAPKSKGKKKDRPIKINASGYYGILRHMNKPDGCLRRAFLESEREARSWEHWGQRRAMDKGRKAHEKIERYLTIHVETQKNISGDDITELERFHEGVYGSLLFEKYLPKVNIENKRFSPPRSLIEQGHTADATATNIFLNGKPDMVQLLYAKGGRVQDIEKKFNLDLDRDARRILLITDFKPPQKQDGAYLPYRLQLEHYATQLEFGRHGHRAGQLGELMGDEYPFEYDTIITSIASRDCFQEIMLPDGNSGVILGRPTTYFAEVYDEDVAEFFLYTMATTQGLVRRWGHEFGSNKIPANPSEKLCESCYAPATKCDQWYLPDSGKMRPGV